MTLQEAWDAYNEAYYSSGPLFTLKWHRTMADHARAIQGACSTDEERVAATYCRLEHDKPVWDADETDYHNKPEEARKTGACCPAAQHVLEVSVDFEAAKEAYEAADDAWSAKPPYWRNNVGKRAVHRSQMATLAAACRDAAPHEDDQAYWDWRWMQFVQANTPPVPAAKPQPRRPEQMSMF